MAAMAPPAAQAAAPAAPAAIVLPGTRVTARENPADPFAVTSYTSGTSAYVRGSAGFSKQASYKEITVAPKGGRALAVPTSYRDGYDSVILVDLATAKGTRIRTVRKPVVAQYVHWTRDAKKAVLTVERKSGTSWETVGFVVVDVAAKTARTVIVAGVAKAAKFRWSPDNTDVIAEYQGGTRFYRQTGEVRRTLARTGRPAGGEDVFSPSGRGLMTWCPATYTEHVCVWDRVSGKLTAKVPGVRPKTVWGWWDEKHIIAVVPNGSAYRAVLVDLKGKVVRALADISAADWNNKLYLSYTRK
ncbi:hypothetical protein DKM19_11015 [Streptosporangium sp. 'caverna']|nr:hypothetical protein DKM19_11015 [Streptosporangium sp. 'caverna']